MQKTEVWRKGMETTEREGLDSMACTGAGGLESWQGREIETRGGGLEVDGM